MLFQGTLSLADFRMCLVDLHVKYKSALPGSCLFTYEHFCTEIVCCTYSALNIMLQLLLEIRFNAAHNSPTAQYRTRQ